MLDVGIGEFEVMRQRRHVCKLGRVKKCCFYTLGMNVVTQSHLLTLRHF